MALSFNQPVVCPILVGRDGDTAALARALERVRHGAGQTVLIAGEAGIGKSRLVATARARAAELGFGCLQGQCLEPDVALPYAPLIDLLRTRLIGLSPAKIAADSALTAPELSRLLPELATLLPSLASPPALGEPAQEKRHLFQALTRFIVAQSSAQPVLMVVEDLHWSDDTSLEFLLALARQAAQHPLLLLLTYRSDEVIPGLRHLLAELDRERLAWELVLAPLTRAGVAAMLEATVGPGMRGTFVDALHALTEGNPFFAEEVLKTLAVTGGLSRDRGVEDAIALDDVRAPRSVEDTVLRRLERLSAPALRALTLAAVAGPRFDFAILRAVAEQDEDEMLRHVKEAVAAQLVVEVSAERFAFRHALTRQAIYGQLLARERQALHRTIYAAIEDEQAAPEEARLADLSYHAFKAGLWEQAATYGRRMGEHALAMGAPQAAIEQFARAFVATRHLGQPLAPDLHRTRGRAYEMRGEFERAELDYAAALDAAHQAGDREGEWQAQLDLGFLWQGRDLARAGDYYRQARTLAGHMDDPGRLAQSLNRLGNWHANMGEPNQARDLHEQALARYRETDDRAGIAATLDLLAVATVVRGNRPLAITYFEEAAVRLRELGDRQRLVSVLATLGNLRSASHVNETSPGPAPDPQKAIDECQEALGIAREIGWRSGEAFALGVLSTCLAASGRYGDALSAAHEALAIATEIEHQGWLVLTHNSLCHIYSDLLDARMACWHGERARAHAAEAGGRLIHTATSFLAQAHLHAREPERARAVLADMPAAEGPVTTSPQAMVLVTQGALSLALGDPAQALRIADCVIEWGARSGGSGATPWLAQLRGDALAALRRTDEAIEALEAARVDAREQGARALLWQIHESLGAIYRTLHRREDAEREYAAAREVIEEMAASVPDETLREQFRARASARVPAPRQPSARSVERARFDGLTVREREVVALIARGHSNSEIAEALIISERTVEAHSGHIRDKLGMTSRAQIAAWAVEHGLVRDAAT
jgi:DNA-binding CsgD family transcriptional regulator